jgi:hypothetical protein
VTSCSIHQKNRQVADGAGTVCRMSRLVTCVREKAPTMEVLRLRIGCHVALEKRANQERRVQLDDGYWMERGMTADRRRGELRRLPVRANGEAG